MPRPRPGGLIDTLHQVQARFFRLLGPVRRALVMPFWLLQGLLDRFFHSFVRGCSAIGIWLARHILRLPLLVFQRAMAWFGQSSTEWRNRINLRYLLQGLPAVAVMFTMAIPLVARDQGKNLGTYEIEAQAALRSGDFERAELLYRALVQTEPDADEYRFRLALANEGLGQLTQAATIMMALAPEDAPGHAMAHFWQAEHRMSDLLDPETASQIENHLVRAIEAKPNYADAHARLGDFYLLTNRLDEAEKHLLASTADNPAMWIQLARVHVLQGKTVEAKADGERALEFFRPKAQADLDDANSRLMWAQSLVFLERYDEAARVLSDGAKASADPRYPQALGRVFFKWSELLRTEPGVKPLYIYELLVRAYTHSPDNPALLRRLVQGLKSRGDDAKLVRAVLRTLGERGQSPATLHVLQAVDAENRQQRQEAIDQLRAAMKLDPRAPLIVAHISMAFIETAPIQYQSAIDVTNLGLTAWPDQPDLLYQRGLVRFRKGSFAEAMVDLNAVAERRPGDFRTHFLLAKLYHNFGMKEQEDRHRALAGAIN